MATSDDLAGLTDHEIVRAVAWYGRALAAVRAEQTRLRAIGYAGYTPDAPTFAVLLTERWAALDALDALALATATRQEAPDGDE